MCFVADRPLKGLKTIAYCDDYNPHTLQGMLITA